MRKYKELLRRRKNAIDACTMTSGRGTGYVRYALAYPTTMATKLLYIPISMCICKKRKKKTLSGILDHASSPPRKAYVRRPTWQVHERTRKRTPWSPHAAVTHMRRFRLPAPHASSQTPSRRNFPGSPDLSGHGAAGLPDGLTGRGRDVESQRCGEYDLISRAIRLV